MTTIRKKLTSIIIILLGLLITTPVLLAQSPNNDQGRRQRATWQQNMPTRRPAIRAHRLARQNRRLRFMNKLQHKGIRRLRTQLCRNRIEHCRENQRNFARNQNSCNGRNCNNNSWGRR